jgi:hypothetical protein
MRLRHAVRLALVLAVVGVQLFTTAAPFTAAQTATPAAARTQKRLAKQSLLKKGAKWLASQQDASGGYVDSFGEVDPAMTAAVVSTLIALRNAGVEVELDAAVAYLQQNNPTRLLSSNAVAGTAQIVMALVAAGGDPRDVDGIDLVERLTKSWDANNGIYGLSAYESPAVVMALAVAGEPIEEQMIETLVTAQADDGSWATDLSGESGVGTTDFTAMIVQALIAAGRADEEVIAGALDFFHAVQADDGAFSYAADGREPDTTTSGYVISALIAAGEDPKAEEWGKAVDGLLAFQNDSGAFRPFSDLATDFIDGTVAALTALAGAYWPVLPTT